MRYRHLFVLSLLAAAGPLAAQRQASSSDSGATATKDRCNGTPRRRDSVMVLVRGVVSTPDTAVHASHATLALVAQGFGGNFRPPQRFVVDTDEAPAPSIPLLGKLGMLRPAPVGMSNLESTYRVTIGRGGVLRAVTLVDGVLHSQLDSTMRRAIYMTDTAGYLAAADGALLAGRDSVLLEFRSTPQVVDDPRMTESITIGEPRGAIVPLFKLRLETGATRSPSRLLSSPMKYPRAALVRGEEASFVAHVRIDARGRVDPASIHFDDTPSFEFAEEAREFLRTATFSPALYDGCPVATDVSFPFVFTLRKR